MVEDLSEQPEPAKWEPPVYVGSVSWPVIRRLMKTQQTDGKAPADATVQRQLALQRVRAVKTARNCLLGDHVIVEVTVHADGGVRDVAVMDPSTGEVILDVTTSRDGERGVLNGVVTSTTNRMVVGFTPQEVQACMKHLTGMDDEMAGPLAKWTLVSVGALAAATLGVRHGPHGITLVEAVMQLGIEKVNALDTAVGRCRMVRTVLMGIAQLDADVMEGIVSGTGVVAPPREVAEIEVLRDHVGKLTHERDSLARGLEEYKNRLLGAEDRTLKAEQRASRSGSTIRGSVVVWGSRMIWMGMASIAMWGAMYLRSTQFVAEADLMTAEYGRLLWALRSVPESERVDVLMRASGCGHVKDVPAALLSGAGVLMERPAMAPPEKDRLARARMLIYHPAVAGLMLFVALGGAVVVVLACARMMVVVAGGLWRGLSIGAPGLWRWMRRTQRVGAIGGG